MIRPVSVNRILLLLILGGAVIPAASQPRLVPPASCEALLRAKRYQQAVQSATAEAAYQLSSLEGTARIRSALASASACRALALVGLGQEAPAEWDWYVAESLDPAESRRWRTAFSVGPRFAPIPRTEIPSFEGARARDQDPAIGPPVAVRKGSPAYPSRAKKLRIEQRIRIEFLIEETGIVRQPRLITENAEPSLAFAAFEAVRRWQFTPGTLAGKPVRVIYVLTINFAMPSPPG
jgi:TonB family protein